jgi:hypothetical protein
LYVSGFWHIHAKTPRGIVVCEQQHSNQLHCHNNNIRLTIKIKQGIMSEKSRNEERNKCQNF